MSLLNRQPKTKLTDNLAEYHKQYRETNLEHIKGVERLKYYRKKYNLEPEFIDKFGEYSVQVYKIQEEFRKIKKECPELVEHILSIL